MKGVQAAIVMNSTFSAKNKQRNNQQIVNKKRDDWEMGYGEGRRWKGVRWVIYNKLIHQVALLKPPGGTVRKLLFKNAIIS